MSSGPQTTIDLLSQKLQTRWVPKWYGAFCDPETNLFYERVGHAFKPVMTGQRRLLTQCRQLSVYAHAASVSKDVAGRFQPDLKTHFDAIAVRYYVPETGGWIFARGDDGSITDDHYDLYGHAFVIFMLAHYYKATSHEKARGLASDTLKFIDRYFRAKGAPGLQEALDKNLKPIEKTRRHESHMHLLEACLFAYEIFEDHNFLAMADMLIALFEEYFYDADQNALSEYYDMAFNPVPNEDGHIVLEPGHYCEWIWLLKKHAAIHGLENEVDRYAVPMLSWANEYGWDNVMGGIFDELNNQNKVIADTKRIWPFTESLKANALMLDSGMDKGLLKSQIAMMIDVFGEHYMDDRGFWTEWLDRSLRPATDYMPGTTPYHVYFGIMETKKCLFKRGPSKSFSVIPRTLYYKTRRGLSDAIRAIKGRA